MGFASGPTAAAWERCWGRQGDSGDTKGGGRDTRGVVGLPPLTGFQEDDLVILAELHEAVDALGELHHVLDGVGDLQRALLPHGLAALWHSRDTQGVLAPWLCDPPRAGMRPQCCATGDGGTGTPGV